MSIQIFKLLNGETVVSECKKTKTGFKFIDPMIMVTNINPNLGVAGLALYKWIPFTQDPVIINKSAIIAIVPASNKLTEFYTKTWEKMRAGDNQPESDLFDSKEEANAMASLLKDYKGTIQ